MREYRTLEYWWSQHVGSRALIVCLPAGSTFIIRREVSPIWEGLDGRPVSLHGVID